MAQLVGNQTEKPYMPIHLVHNYHLLPNPTGSCRLESKPISAEGFVVEPTLPDLFVKQGDDPPFGGSGSKRSVLETLYGPESAERYDSRISAQLQARIQFRVAQISNLLSSSGTYVLPEDEFEQSFDLPVEIQALHRIVEANWGDEDMARAVGGHAWIIRLASLKAYLEMHMQLLSITLEDQRTALGCLRNWFYLDEKSLAGAATKAYENLIKHMIEHNAADRPLIQDLLEKEQKALEASLKEHPEPSPGKDYDQNALAFVYDLTKTI